MTHRAARQSVTDQQLDDMLAQARTRDWAGQDRTPRVDCFLEGVSMQSQRSKSFTHSAVALIGIGALAGASLGSLVTHSVMSRRAVMITDDGVEHHMGVVEEPGTGNAQFVTDDGTVYELDMDQ